MISEFQGKRRIFTFPKAWANAVARWIAGIHSPNGTMEISNTLNPGDDGSIGLDVNMDAVVDKVKMRLGFDKQSPLDRNDVRDIVFDLLDGASVINSGRRVSVSKDWLNANIAQVGGGSGSGGEVSSVNGKTGAVVLTYTDVDAASSDALDTVSQSLEDLVGVVNGIVADYLSNSDIGVTVAAVDHTHDGYAASDHNHDGVYASNSHSHTGYAASSHSHGNITSDGKISGCTSNADCFLITNSAHEIVHSNSDPSVSAIRKIQAAFDVSGNDAKLDVSKVDFGSVTNVTSSNLALQAETAGLLTKSAADGYYAAMSHAHTGYAAADHTHDYAASSHTHGQYASKSSLETLSGTFSEYVAIVDGIVADYVTSDSLTTTLSAYSNTDTITATLANYVLKTDLDETLLDFVQNDDLDEALESYVTTDTAQDISATKNFTSGIVKVTSGGVTNTLSTVVGGKMWINAEGLVLNGKSANAVSLNHAPTDTTGTNNTYVATMGWTNNYFLRKDAASNTYSQIGHTHNYAAADHTHTGYAASSHTHGQYASTESLTALYGSVEELAGIVEVINANYVTNDSLSTTLSAYSNTETITSTLANYVLTTDLDETLLDFVQNDDLDEALESYVTTDTAQDISATKNFTSGIVKVTSGGVTNTLSTVVGGKMWINAEGLVLNGKESNAVSLNHAPTDTTGTNNTYVATMGWTNNYFLRKDAASNTYSQIGHTHNYAAADHTHTGYAASSHTHGQYASTESLTALYGSVEELAGIVEVINANYVTSDSLTSTLSAYSTTDTINDTLANYVLTTDLNTTLQSYALLTDLDDYVSIEDIDVAYGVAGLNASGKVDISKIAAPANKNGFLLNTGGEISYVSGKSGTTNIDVVTGISWTGTQLVATNSRLTYENGILSAVTSLNNTVINTVTY